MSASPRDIRGNGRIQHFELDMSKGDPAELEWFNQTHRRPSGKPRLNRWKIAAIVSILANLALLACLAYLFKDRILNW